MLFTTLFSPIGRRITYLILSNMDLGQETYAPPEELAKSMDHHKQVDLFLDFAKDCSPPTNV